MKFCVLSIQFKMLLSMGLLMLSACTSTPFNPDLGRYDQTDWYEVGRQDGISGEPAKKFRSYILMCEHTKSRLPNKDLYDAGRGIGLAEYCTPKSAQQLGKMGTPYNDICPPHLKEDFAHNYALGQRMFELNSAKNEIDSKIQELTNMLRKDPEIGGKKRELQAELNHLKNQLSSVDSELASIELRTQNL
jgi:Protein of unknown function (DUF2799)